jgi:hypothetical protein
MRTLLLFASLAVAAALPSFAALSWQDPRWRIEAKESKVEPHLGRDSLFLREGNAWLDGAALRDGVIEVDIAAPSEVGFHGVAFRAADHENYELFYLRSHLSKHPDATQYTPVFHGIYGWQIYTSKRYVQPAEIGADRWVHVRMAIRGSRLEVSVDGQLLIFPQLVRDPAAGAVGLMASAGGAHFCNFEFHPTDDPALNGGGGAPADMTPEGTITRWRVSTTFPESKIESVTGLQWEDLGVGDNGIANLAMLRRRENTNNTVFASMTLHADKAGTLRVRFGYSDRVVAFLNGRAIYRGIAQFGSRDPRFLGSIGLFDELDLPLRAGDNELRFAVSEDFGGWGIIAAVAHN